MSERDTTQAFPLYMGINRTQGDFCFGMTLRDYFAAKIASAIINGALASGNPASDKSAEDFAKDAYAVADAMLKAREQ